MELAEMYDSTHVEIEDGVAIINLGHRGTNDDNATLVVPLTEIVRWDAYPVDTEFEAYLAEKIAEVKARAAA